MVLNTALRSKAQSISHFISSCALHTNAASAECIVLIPHLAVTAISPRKIMTNLPFATTVYTSLTFIHICRTRESNQVKYSLLKINVYEEKKNY